MSLLDTTPQGSEPVDAPAPLEAPWYASLEPEYHDTIGKKYTSLSEFAKGHSNLEKYLGADKNTILKVPSERTPEAMRPIYDLVGVPKDPSGYDIPLPEGSVFSKDDIGELAQVMHQTGVSAEAAQKLVEWYNNKTAALGEHLTQDNDVANYEFVNTLKKDWGMAFDANIKVVNAFLNKMAETPEQASEYRSVVENSRNPAFVNMILKLAEQTVPAQDVEGLLATRPTSPQAARARMMEIEKNPMWMDINQMNNPARKMLVEEYAKLADIAIA